MFYILLVYVITQSIIRSVGGCDQAMRHAWLSIFLSRAKNYS